MLGGQRKFKESNLNIRLYIIARSINKICIAICITLILFGKLILPNDIECFILSVQMINHCLIQLRVHVLCVRCGTASYIRPK